MKTKAIYLKKKEDLDPKTKTNKALEIEKINEAVQHVHRAIQALADAPQMDFCGDKQAYIQHMEEMLNGDEEGAPGSGLAGLSLLLKAMK